MMMGRQALLDRDLSHSLRLISLAAVALHSGVCNNGQTKVLTIAGVAVL